MPPPAPSSSLCAPACEASDLETQAAELLPVLKEKLGVEAKGLSDETLLKYLMWKADPQRAMERILAHKKWRALNLWAFDTVANRAGEDPALAKFLESEVVVAPDGMFTKDGSPVVIGRLRNNDMNDGRTAEDVCRGLLYTVDRVLENKEAQKHGVVVLHDLTGLRRSNIHPAIPKMLFGALIGNLPIKIKAIYLYNAPFFFRGVFAAVSLMLPAKLKVPPFPYTNRRSLSRFPLQFLLY
jgi:hypothetical protein